MDLIMWHHIAIKCYCVSHHWYQCVPTLRRAPVGGFMGKKMTPIGLQGVALFEKIRIDGLIGESVSLGVNFEFSDAQVRPSSSLSLLGACLSR